MKYLVDISGKFAVHIALYKGLTAPIIYLTISRYAWEICNDSYLHVMQLKLLSISNIKTILSEAKQV
jgi:hypothetical protein